MSDSDLILANEYQAKRNLALRHANYVDNNGSIMSHPEVFAFAFSALNAEEHRTVKKILVDACKRNASNYQERLDEFGRL